ncbi:hypothetical protein Q3G72_012931 [Acer saccharum]|nr:hypothetical protein Q3G72_012931 [Acer saccharum]
MSNFPSDLIVDILLYLPGNLYVDSNLETSLLQQEPSSSSPSYRKVVPIKHDRPFKEEYDHHSFGYNSWVVVSESSNGLFCTTKLDPPDHDFCVYNPSTRESKKIPKIESEKESYNSSLFTLHGFGYAESIDDYKFVKVLIKRKIILIFSLRQNSWKTVKCDFPFNVNSSHVTSLPFTGGVNYGIPLNGAIHWVVTASF